MSLTKRYLEDVAEELGKDDIMDPEVLAEAQRRLDDPQLQRKSSIKLPSEDEDYDFDDEDDYADEEYDEEEDDDDEYEDDDDDPLDDD